MPIPQHWVIYFLVFTYLGFADSIAWRWP